MTTLKTAARETSFYEVIVDGILTHFSLTNEN